MQSLPISGTSLFETLKVVHNRFPFLNALELETSLSESRNWRDRLGSIMRKATGHENGDGLTYWARRVEYNTVRSITKKNDRPSGYESISTWASESAFLTLSQAQKYAKLWALENPNEVILFTASYETPFVPKRLMVEAEDLFKKEAAKAWDHVKVEKPTIKQQENLLFMKLEDALSDLTEDEKDLLASYGIVLVYQVFRQKQHLCSSNGKLYKRLCIRLGLSSRMFPHGTDGIEEEYLRRRFGANFELPKKAPSFRIEALMMPLVHAGGYVPPQKGSGITGRDIYSFEYVFEVVEKTLSELSKIEGFRVDKFRNWCRMKDIEIGKPLSREEKVFCWLKKVL